jgi:hypothetical protein
MSADPDRSCDVDVERKKKGADQQCAAAIILLVHTCGPYVEYKRKQSSPEANLPATLVVRVDVRIYRYAYWNGYSYILTYRSRHHVVN